MENRVLFGLTASGTPVERLHLHCGTMACDILTLGATLQSLVVNGLDVVLGYDSVQEYTQQDAYLGAVVGRYANRIAKGSFCLQDREYTLAVNNGPNHLHGGIDGFSYRIWQVERLTDSQAVLTMTSPDGDEGYPGTLLVKVTYTLSSDGLSITYDADCDQDTVCNLTNHAYFNLNGQGSGSVLNQKIRIFAQSYTPTDENGIPLGIIAPVAGTPMDLCDLTSMGRYIEDGFTQLVQARGYDHNYVVDGEIGVMRPAAEAVCEESGLTMLVQTTMPGVQFYTANYLEEGRKGKGDTHYGPRHGFCLETQFYPDSPNQGSFPSAVLPADGHYHHETSFTFRF